MKRLWNLRVQFGSTHVMGEFESDESADRFGVNLGYFNASPNFRADQNPLRTLMDRPSRSALARCSSSQRDWHESHHAPS
jgi:hypothetical protein